MIPFLCMYAATLNASPRIVTSIVPLQEITAAITRGIAEPAVIISANASLHHFAFRPSHMHLLQQADLVIWVDRRFEGGFYRLPEFLPPSARQLELMPALGTGPEGSHFWYSPRLLLMGIDIISDALARLDPPNRDGYRRNAAALQDGVRAWRDDLRSRWASSQPRALTDHAFLEPMARELGLEHILSLRDQHDERGGLKDLNRLENRLQSEPVLCLLSLETSPSPSGRSIARKYQLRTISITRGIDTNPPREAILHRLNQLTISLDSCTGQNQPG